MTTQDISSTLGVSRNWINTYLRAFGVKKVIRQGLSKSRPQVVVDYNDQKLLMWLNQNAVFERQTVKIPYSYFGLISDEEAKKILEKIEKIKDVDQQINAYRALYARAVPDEIRAKDIRGSHDRHRIDSWVPVDMTIQSFEQLRSIESILKSIKHTSASPELAYRFIYRAAMIRVKIKGRVWFMTDPGIESSNLPMLLLPAELII